MSKWCWMDQETMEKYEVGKVNLNGFYITRFYDLEWNCANTSYPVSNFWVAGRENTARYKQFRCAQ